MSLQAIKYARGSLHLLDQRLLPFETVYLEVPDAKAAWTQIRDMVVRGAPAIGVTGALAMAVELHTNKAGGKSFSTVADTLTFIINTLDYLVTRCARPGASLRPKRGPTCLGHAIHRKGSLASCNAEASVISFLPPSRRSRPTAVNLADAAIKLRRVAETAAAADGATPVSISTAVIEAAEAFLEEDIAANKVRLWGVWRGAGAGGRGPGAGVIPYLVALQRHLQVWNLS